MFRRKPRITEEIYTRLMTSFGRVVAADPLIGGPAAALADRVCAEDVALVEAADRALYRGAVHHHMRLLAGAWILSQEGGTPAKTAEVFEEAVAWKLEPAVKGVSRLARRTSELATGAGERDTHLE